MKAWEYIYDLTKNAVPVVLSDEEQTWEASNAAEKQVDGQLRLYWASHVPGSHAPESVVIAAVQSMEALGCDVTAAEELIPEGLSALKQNDMKALQRITARIFNILFLCPSDTSSDYWKSKLYQSFNEYEQAVVFPEVTAAVLPHNILYDKTKAAWLGRLCGGGLGTALEGYTTAQLQKKFGEIRTYVRNPNTYNDDITYEIAFLEACCNVRGMPSSADIADKWLELIPCGWSAEQVALDNLRRGMYPPESGTFRNPYREWIGAQMRGAVCGQVAPLNPQKAVLLAWRDAEISHHGNGILGEVFNAVLVSLAYGEDPIRICLEKAVSCIPKDSEYASVLHFALGQCMKKNDFYTAWAACEEKYKRYNWIHAYPNAAAEVVALYFGKDNFNDVMHYIAMCGQDVDCNAAQLGAALGAKLGTKGIEERWTDPFGDEIVTYLRGNKTVSLQELINKTIAVVKQLEDV